MENLAVQTQGIKGGNPKTNISGYALISEGRNKISVDNFTGTGDDYKQRENAEVFVEVDGETLFQGTFKELKKMLEKAKKWDKLDEEISTYYSEESEDDEYSEGLAGIGMAAATAFEYL